MGEKPAKAPRGRPTRYTKKIGGRIVKLLAAGVSFQAAAQTCGIGRRTLFEWVARGRADSEKLEEGITLALPAPEELEHFEPPDLLSFFEAVQIARASATSLHEANFARHARADWRASYAWLRHHRPDLWGDHTKGDPLPGPKKKARALELKPGENDLAGEIAAARVRLEGFRRVILEGGTAALPLDRALVLEGHALSVLARLVKAQHEVNPAAGKTGDFKVLVELTGAAAGVDMGDRVPNLEAGALPPVEPPPEEPKDEEPPDEWGDP